MNDKNFIEELRQKREEYGVTQTRLAVACGISREYYNRIEKQTYTVKIERMISDDIKQLLLEKCSDLHFVEDKIMFQDETLIIDIQKILLQKGHYICGFSVQKNNLKSLFGMEE